MAARVQAAPVTFPAPLPSWVAAWSRYWFSETDVHAYAALRIGLGLVGLLGLAGLTPIEMHWRADGLAPVIGGGVGIRPLLAAAGVANVVGYGLCAVLWISFTSMVVGYRTSASVLACLIGSTLQGFWNPLPLSSSHKVLVALLFCLVWADCGRVLSLDAWRGKALDSFTTTAIWPLRMLRLQVALIYLGSGVTKLFGDLWRDGTALHYTLQINVFHRFPVHFPSSADPVLTAVTYATLLWELGFVVLILSRHTRAGVLAIGAAMHIGMALTLELGTFSAVMLTSYLAFIDPETIKKGTSGLRHLFSRTRLVSSV